MIIGICDDCAEDRFTVHGFCMDFFTDEHISGRIIEFSSSEEVMKYCMDSNNDRIDLLLLDIEMDGLNGIELKDMLNKNSKVWRVAFVSRHTESAIDGYSTKTIGFVPKPIQFETINKILKIALSEFCEDEIICISRYNGKMVKLFLSDIVYLKADDSYTEVYTYKTLCQNPQYILVAKKLGALEKKMNQESMVRVHKSYLVNMVNVEDIGTEVIFRDLSLRVPVGRKYKEEAKNKFYEFVRSTINRRL